MGKGMLRFILPAVASVSSVAIAWLLAVLFTLRRKKAGMPVKRRRIIITVSITFLLFFGGSFIFFGIYYHADERALKYMESTDTVKVTEVSTGYKFDGPGTDDAIIFYPGAKVEETAYAPLMRELAEKGVDTFLVKMPLRMAFLGKTKAGDVMEENPEYRNWYISGHSLGGAMGAVYAIENPDKLAGAVLLAGYFDSKFPDGLRLLSIVAGEDKVLEWDNYNNGKRYWPKDATELKIEGGNHSGFGDYGEQSGDGTASISHEEQQRQVVEAAIKFIKG